MRFFILAVTLVEHVLGGEFENIASRGLDTIEFGPLIFDAMKEHHNGKKTHLKFTKHDF
jgi:hypothetical protein